MDEIIEVSYRRRGTGQTAILRRYRGGWFHDEDWLFELENDPLLKDKSVQFRSVEEATGRIERDKSWDIMYIRYYDKETKRSWKVKQSRIPEYNKFAGWN